MRESVEGPSDDEIQLTLFVSSRSARCAVVIECVIGACRELGPRCRLELVEVERRPDLAELHRVIATPLLVRSARGVVTRFVGDLGSREELAATALPELRERDRAAGRRPPPDTLGRIDPG